MIQYNGYKLLDTIMLICKESSSNSDIYKAYIVDPNNTKQVESIRYWSEWIEYERDESA